MKPSPRSSVPQRNYRAAAALEYEGESAAPTVSVNGDNADPDEVVRIARRFGIPVVERPELARTLSRLPEGAAIPAALYRAVAQILCYLEGRYGKQRGGEPQRELESDR